VFEEAEPLLNGIKDDAKVISGPEELRKIIENLKND
jgi:hypothetical protein